MRVEVAPLKSTSAGYLPPLCMLFERSLRFRGVHEYTYSIYEGEALLLALQHFEFTVQNVLVAKF